MLGDGGEDVSIVPVLYPCGTFSVSSLGSFSSVGSSSKTSHPSLTVFLGARHIQEYFNNKRVRKWEFVIPQQEKASHEERMNQNKVIVREKLVVGYWELILIESGVEFLSLQHIATFSVAEERLASNKQSTYW